MFTDADLIFSYTRTDALRDGVLIDVTERAREAGFRVPVAVTAGVWAECIAWPETEPNIQDEGGRLWDVVFMAAVAARRAARRGEGNRTVFELMVLPQGGLVRQPTSLVLHIGLGDQGEPVGTIMQPGEDCSENGLSGDSLPLISSPSPWSPRLVTSAEKPSATMAYGLRS